MPPDPADRPADSPAARSERDTPPLDLDLKRDERLVVTWADGRRTTYPIAYLRRHCPCATCRKQRESESREPAAPAARTVRSRLSVLPTGTGTGPLSVRGADLVGNYALRLDWSDGHASGIYSFAYLREVAPPDAADGTAA